jgi:GntR family transcriptional regulator
VDVEGRTPTTRWGAMGGGIDRSSPLPFYHQLKELLRQEITTGRWLPGARIPSESELCSLFEVSRTVVRQAPAASSTPGGSAPTW